MPTICSMVLPARDRVGPIPTRQAGIARLELRRPEVFGAWGQVKQPRASRVKEEDTRRSGHPGRARSKEGT
ncbi:MAG: hypothetical protein OXG81_10335 [Acidobacteria bacterium]|nr:hypothetical protein [Acidobacteriota bacterium]